MAIQGAMQVQIPASAVGANGYTFTINWPLAGVDLTTADTLSGNIRLTETGDPFPISGLLTATGPNTLTWKLHSSDTLTQGTAEVQFRATFGTDNIISAPSKWLIYNTMSGALPPPDPSAVSFIRNNGDGTYSFLNAADFRTAIGAGTGDGDMPLIDPVLAVGNLPTIDAGGSLVDAGYAADVNATAGSVVRRDGTGRIVNNVALDSIAIDATSVEGVAVRGASTDSDGGRFTSTNGNGGASYTTGGAYHHVFGFPQLSAIARLTGALMFLGPNAVSNRAAQRTELGLGTAATQDTTAFDAAGSAAGVQGNLDTHTGDATIHFTQAAISITPAQAGADPAGSAATVQENLDTHTGLTTTAHGGIVADTDPRLTDARTPTAHAFTHATGGSDPLAPADIGAEVAGTTATHAALTGTAVHGLGTAALLNSTAVGEDLVTAVDVDGAREVLGLPAQLATVRRVEFAAPTLLFTNTGSGTVGQVPPLFITQSAGTTANSTTRTQININAPRFNSTQGYNWDKRIVFDIFPRLLTPNVEGVFRIFYGKQTGDVFGTGFTGRYVGVEILDGDAAFGLVASNAAISKIALTGGAAINGKPIKIISTGSSSVSWYIGGILAGSTSSNVPNGVNRNGTVVTELNNGAAAANYSMLFWHYADFEV